MSREERKRDILRVSAEVFASRGYRPTTVDYLVEEAGISKGLFYIYFDSKRQAFIEVIESYFIGLAGVLEENHRRLEDVYARKAGAVELLETWRDNVTRVLQFSVDNPSLTIVVFQEALGSDGDFSERVAELSQYANSMVAEEFRMMVESGIVRPIDVEMVAAIAMGGMVYTIMDLLLNKKWTDVDKLADEMMGYHARGLSLPGVDTDALLKMIPPRAAGRKSKAKPGKTP